jgi:PTEN phosphatase family protein
MSLHVSNRSSEGEEPLLQQNVLDGEASRAQSEVVTGAGGHSLVQMDCVSSANLGSPTRADRSASVNAPPALPERIVAVMHRFFMSFPIVVAMILVTLLDVSFLIYEFVSGSTEFEVVTLMTSLSFFIELMVHLGHMGPALFFMFNRYWMIAEAGIVSLSFVVEYCEFILEFAVPDSDIANYVRYLRAIRFFRVFILMKTRQRKLAVSLRRLVSADRRRYQEGGYDLDLTYVHDSIIAMSWPSEKAEAFYRNHIDVVASFLRERHQGHYHVYSLCSERTYNEAKFGNHVSRYMLDDHNPAQLPLMLTFAQEVHRRIQEDPAENVAVIHCKGGKGRTGTMVCTYMLFAGLHPDATSALKQFGMMRTSDDAKSFQGVESPSQERFVRYFDRLLREPGQVPPRRTVRLTRLRMTGIPLRFWDVGKIWFAIITKPNEERNVHYKSNPGITFSAQQPEWQKKKRTRSMAPANDLDDAPPANSQAAFQSEECCAFYGNMMVRVYERQAVGGADAAEVLDGLAFVEKYCTPASSGRIQADDYHVTVEFSTSGIKPFSNDTVIKVFHNVDDPATNSAPIQIWLHPSFEQDEMVLGKGLVDGPHKDASKHRKYPKDFTVELGMETVDDDVYAGM